MHVASIVGHADPNITLDTYSHFFNEARAREIAKEKLAAMGFGSMGDSRIT